METKLNLLIHADPGARSGFLAAWLTDKLTMLSFDTGLELKPNFKKIHYLNHPTEIESFNGIKIRIKPKLESIDLHSLLFLRKNVYTQIPEFTRDEYSLATFTKLTVFSKEIFEWDSKLDYSLYDHVLDFKNTFDSAFMKQLYTTITGHVASESSIKILEDTNKINQIQIDKNHACSILKLILTMEHQLELKEEHRFWSIVDIYNTIKIEDLYDTVRTSITPKNYGVFLQ